MSDSGRSPPWEESEGHYYGQEQDQDIVRRRRRWRNTNFASFDSKSWDQAKQTISKGEISRRSPIQHSNALHSEVELLSQVLDQ